MEGSNNKFQIWKFKVCTIIIMIILIFFEAITLNVSASNPTTVTISPSTQTFSQGDTFSVSVACVPGQAIKAYEFKISFNPTYLQANLVSEGNIFSGYNTYFNSGTIDNNDGKIIYIYGIIIGSGDVTGSGTFVSIQFTAKSVSGTSTICIYDAGVTDDTSYIDIAVSNGSVQIDASSPQISNILSSTSYPIDTDSQFGWVNISCDVTDNIDVSGVYIIITKPDGSNINVSMSGINSYYYNSSTTFSSYGVYNYYIWTSDDYGNNDISSSSSITISPNWDIDMDGECTLYDLTLVSSRYTDTGSAGWIREDVDNNGEIQILDIVLLSAHYNEAW